MDKSREAHDMSEICGDEEPKPKSGSGSLQDFQTAETHASPPLEKSLPPLDSRDDDMDLDSIHSRCEAESIWKGQDSSNDSWGSASDTSEGSELQELSLRVTGQNKHLPSLPQPIVTSQDDSLKPPKTCHTSDSRSMISPLAGTVDPRGLHKRLFTGNLDVAPEDEIVPSPQTARRSSDNPDSVYRGASLASEGAHEDEDTESNSQGSNEDGCELFEHFELEGISKTEFRAWVKQAPPEDLEIARADVLQGTLDLEELEKPHSSGQAAHGGLANVPEDAASIQLQQENDSSQSHARNKRGHISMLQFPVDDKTLDNRACSTTLPPSEFTPINNVQNLPDHLLQSLMRSQVDFYVKSHPFYRSPHIPHTITERRDFTRDVYDYSRARGLTAAQSQTEVKRAAKAYRKCRRLTKVLQWMDIARAEARSMEDELQRIRDEEGWDTDDIEGNFSDDDSDEGTNLGTEIDDSTELLNEATRMIQSAAEDIKFSPIIHSDMGEKEILRKELRNKLKRSHTDRETDDSKTSPLRIQPSEIRDSDVREMKATSTRQESSRNCTPILEEKPEAKQSRGARRKKKDIWERPGKVLKGGNKEGDGCDRTAETATTEVKESSALKISGGILPARGGNHETKSIKRDSPATGTPLDAGVSRDLKRSHKRLKKDKASKLEAAVSELHLLGPASATQDGKRGTRDGKKKRGKNKTKVGEEATNQQTRKQTSQSEPQNSRYQRENEKIEHHLPRIPHEEIRNVPDIEPKRKSTKKRRKRREKISLVETQASVEKSTPDFRSPNDSPSKAGDEGIVSNSGRSVLDTDSSNSMHSIFRMLGSRDDNGTRPIEHNAQVANYTLLKPQITGRLTGFSRDGGTDESCQDARTSPSGSSFIQEVRHSTLVTRMAGSTDTPPRSLFKCRTTSLRSPYFEASSAGGLPKGTQKSGSVVPVTPFPPLSSHGFGLVQEKLAHEPFKLLVGATLLNRTKGIHAIPVIFLLTEKYPTPKDMAEADENELAQATRHLGMQNIRAKRYIELAKAWLADPPLKGRRHRKLHYPRRGDGKDIKPHEIISDDDPRIGAWEIAHLPTAGPYALDSWRIFHRDEFRGLATNWTGLGACTKDFEPEWKRVVPKDKELRAYLRWMWLKEGWEWDPQTGGKVVASEELMEKARTGTVLWEEERGEEMEGG